MDALPASAYGCRSQEWERREGREGRGFHTAKVQRRLMRPLKGGWPDDSLINITFYKRTINYAFSIAKVFHAHSCIADGRHHVCFVGMRQERLSRQRSTKNHLRH
uniref:Uncharacterized protein n=1 Tax=mine drainage metagenome TaxID=410659 RepID=E6Q8E1_9ZZZZ